MDLSSTPRWHGDVVFAVIPQWMLMRTERGLMNPVSCLCLPLWDSVKNRRPESDIDVLVVLPKEVQIVPSTYSQEPPSRFSVSRTQDEDTEPGHACGGSGDGEGEKRKQKKTNEKKDVKSGLDRTTVATFSSFVDVLRGPRLFMSAERPWTLSMRCSAISMSILSTLSALPTSAQRLFCLHDDPV